MVKRLRWMFPVLFLGASAAVAGNGKLEIAYTLLQERGRAAVVTSVHQGFDSGDGFRLHLRPMQECYAYLVVQHAEDDFRLLFPDRRTRRGQNRLAKKKALVWPHQGWLRLDDDSGVDRMVLVVSREPVPELEALYVHRTRAFPESVVLGIRDRYQGDNSYRRKLDDSFVKVRFKSRHGAPALLIEEILLRHR